MHTNTFKSKFNNKLKIKNLRTGILFSQKIGAQIEMVDNKVKLKLKKLENSNYQIPFLKEHAVFRSLKRYLIVRRTFGIGSKKATFFFNELGLNSRLKIIRKKSLITKKLHSLVNTNTFNKDLWSKVKSVISFHINLKTYKGIRHKYNYPVRGQRTHTNAKTRKKYNKKKNKKIYGKKVQKKLLQKKTSPAKKLQKNKKP